MNDLLEHCSNDRIRSKLAKMHVRSSSPNEFNLHSRLLPKTYFTKFNNRSNEAALLRYRNVKLSGKINSWSLSKKNLKTLPASAIQRFQDIDVSIHRLNKSCELNRMLKRLKFLKTAVIKSIMDSQENSLKVFKTAMHYLPFAENKFTFGYDENDGSYTPLLSSVKRSFQEISGIYKICEKTRKILQYVPLLCDIKMTNITCLNLSNLIDLKLKNVKEIAIESFWNGLAEIQSLENLSIEVDNCRTHLGNFDKFGVSLLKLKRLKQLSISFYDQDDISSEWWYFLKRLQKQSNLPQKAHLILNIRVMLVARGDKDLLQVSNIIEETKSIKRTTADKKLCKYLPVPSAQGIRLAYKLSGESRSESICFSCNIENGKFVVNALETETTEYLQIHQKALSFGSKITKIKCTQFFFNPPPKAMTFEEDFNKKAPLFINLTKFELFVEGSTTQCIIPVSGVSYLDKISCLKLTFVFQKDEESESESQIIQEPPIREMLQILKGKTNLKKFKFKFWGYLLDLSGIDNLTMILFQISDFQKFTLDLRWENLSAKQKRILLKCLDPKDSIKIEELDIHCVTNRNKKDVESEIAYFKQLLLQNENDDEKGDREVSNNAKEEEEEKSKRELMQIDTDIQEEEDLMIEEEEDDEEEEKEEIEIESQEQGEEDNTIGDDVDTEERIDDENEADDEFPYATRIYFVKRYPALTLVDKEI